MTGTPFRVLGIDPSLRCTGWGGVEQKGNALRSLAFGTIRNKASMGRSECLGRIHETVTECIATLRPDVAAIEGGFYLRNARTALILGEVRGAVIAACAGQGVPVFEYAPRRVKQSLVGIGSANKDQVGRMVMTLLNPETKPPEDAADALAVAVCHLHSRSGYQSLDAKPL
jgi:crossover junction endodeoxyribonuclease RuvC